VSDTGVDGARSVGAVAAVDMSTSTPDDVARLAAAVATGWPTMDMAARLADDTAYLVAMSPASAGVTDADGSVRFDVTIDRHDWEVGFFVQAPTDDVSLYSGTGIQGQITWAGAPQSAIAHEIAAPPALGEVAVRKVLAPADIGAGRDLSGFEFAVSALSGVEGGAGDDVVLRTDASGLTPTFEVPAGRYRVAEVSTPAWAVGLIDGGPIEFDIEPDGSGTVLEVAYTNTEPAASITTAARDQADGDQMVDLTQGDATIIDSVAYDGLVPGTEYVASGELMHRPHPTAENDDDSAGDDTADDDATIDLTPTGIVGSTTFVAAAPSGSIDVRFVVPTDSPLVGDALVAHQRIEVRSSGRTVAAHHDPTSIEQTIWMPFVSTTLLADDTDHTSGASVQPGDPLVDLVAVFGLRPDRRYRTDLTLHQRLDDGTCVATDHTASAEFDVTADDRPATVAVRGINAPDAGVFVAFQVVSVLEDDGERVVATHAECDSVAQRVEVVEPPVESTTTSTTTTSTTTTSTTSTTTTPTVPTTTSPTGVPTTTIGRPSRAAPPARVPTTARPTAPLSRTGTDASTTLAVVGLALLLVGVGVTSVVRRRPTGRRPTER
jgi:hypothetical protein